MGQIAGYRNMIGPGFGQILLQRCEYSVAMLGFAMQLPFKVAEKS